VKGTALNYRERAYHTHEVRDHIKLIKDDEMNTIVTLIESILMIN
jgi:hypothetical protein